MPHKTLCPLPDDLFDALPVALDDVIEDMTPYPTPLDQVWKRAFFPVVKRIESKKSR